MNFTQAKKEMRNFAIDYSKGVGTGADIDSLIYYLRDKATRTQEKILARIFNKIHNKHFEHQYKIDSISGFANAASEFNI